MTRRAGADADETRVRLTHAASSEFLDRGFEGSSLRRICAAAGVTTGALYCFFESKEDLFNKVVGPTMELIRSVIDAHYAKERSLMAFERSVRIGEEIPSTQANVNLYDDDLDAIRSMVRIMFEHREVVRLVLASRERPLVATFFGELASLIEGQTVCLLDFWDPRLRTTRAFGPSVVRWSSLQQVNMVLYVFDSATEAGEATELAVQLATAIEASFYTLLDRACREIGIEGSPEQAFMEVRAQWPGGTGLPPIYEDLATT